MTEAKLQRHYMHRATKICKARPSWERLLCGCKRSWPNWESKKVKMFANRRIIFPSYNWYTVICRISRSRVFRRRVSDSLGAGLQWTAGPGNPLPVLPIDDVRAVIDPSLSCHDSAFQWPAPPKIAIKSPAAPSSQLILGSGRAAVHHL